MARARLQDLAPILDVRDLEKALRYYTERLGFELAFRSVDGPDNYAGIGRDGVQLHMQWQAPEAFARGAGQGRVRVRVDDPDALLREFQATGGVEASVQVRDTPWGTREFGFQDPDGNGFAFYRDVG